MAVAAAGFDFYTTAEYFEELRERIAGTAAGSRVVVATMTLSPGRPEVRGVLDELEAAARRGVDACLIVDAKQFLLPGRDNSVGAVPGPLFFNGELPLKLRGSSRVIMKALDSLQDAGGRYVIANQPGQRFTNPVSGRSHLKFAVTGDRLFVGGCNLNTNTHVDMMVGWNDPKTAVWLSELAGKIEATGSVRLALDGQDTNWGVDETTSLLVDAGVRGQSIIFEKALELIDAARERIAMSSQFFPNDVTARHLLAAHRRGVQVEIFYNYPGQFGWPDNLLHHGVILRAKRSLPRSFFYNSQRRNYLHAKMVVTEQAAIVGSHNHVRVGVKLGTAEMALLSNDPQFGKRVLSTLHRQVDGEWQRR